MMMLVDYFDKLALDIKNHRIIIGYTDSLNNAMELSKMITK